MRLNVRKFAVIFPALLVGHQVGDHLVQTDWQARNKGSKIGDRRSDINAIALTNHVTTYHLTVGALAYAATKIAGERNKLLPYALGLAFSAATHRFLDLRWPVRYLLEKTGSPDFARAHEIEMIDHLKEGENGELVIVRKDELILPLHGMYLADQSLHWFCLWVSSLIMSLERK